MSDDLCPICGRLLAECDCVRDDNGRSIAPKQHPVRTLEDDLYERYLKKIQNDKKEEKKHELQGKERRGVLAHRQENGDGVPASHEPRGQKEAVASLGDLQSCA